MSNKTIYILIAIALILFWWAGLSFLFYFSKDTDKKINMGDARLVLEGQESQQFDVLAVDAFSSDAIPIHLLTREALALYFKHLKPNGFLALHISNRYLDLAPVCAAGAKYFNKTAPQMLNDKTFPPEFSLAVGHLVTGSLSIPLSSFEATDYKLEIKVTDKVSGKSITQNVQFNVGA